MGWYRVNRREVSKYMRIIVRYVGEDVPAVYEDVGVCGDSLRRLWEIMAWLGRLRQKN